MTNQRSMDPFLMLGAMILMAAMLTWVLPAGRFQRIKDEKTGRTLVVPGSFRSVPRTPVGPGGALTSIPQGMIEAAEVIFYVLLAGGAITVVEATGAMSNFLDHTTRRFGHSPMLVLAIASILFLIGGAAESMYEEILAFLPLLRLLMRRMGLDPVIALGVSVGTASVAGAFSPFNTFTLGISQPIAQLPLFSGFGFRTVFFVLAMAIWAGYLAWYAKRFPAAGPKENSETDAARVSKWSARDLAVLVILNGGIALIVGGGIFLHWELREFAAVFLAMALAAGLVGGLGWRGTSEQLAEGFRRMIVAAAIIGFARAISVVLADGQVLDTIANALFNPLRNLPVGLSAVMMFISQSILAVPMPSDSGRAMMSLPVAIPLADLLGVSRQVVVTAYQYGGVVSNLMTPSGGTLLAMLAIAGVSFRKWLQFMAIPFLLLSILGAAAMIAGVKLAIQ